MWLGGCIFVGGYILEALTKYNDQKNQRLGGAHKRVFELVGESGYSGGHEDEILRSG